MGTSQLNSFHRYKIIPQPTPVQYLPGVGRWLGIPRLTVKREDQTDSDYGGNKVRNLEFIIGEALARGAERLTTVAPRGSNFVAALAAQTDKLGMPVTLVEFNPAQSELIEAQAHFSRRPNVQRVDFAEGTYLTAARAWRLARWRSWWQRKTYWISPGGSSPIGVLGHLASVLELKQQISRGEVDEPDVIVVGAGTCGTVAGLMAGMRVTGLRTKVIGVRCVDRIVCNAWRVAQLANSVLRLVGARPTIALREVILRDNGPICYGRPPVESRQILAQMQSLSGIQLDTTYTSKVIEFLRSSAPEFTHSRVMYWHTFSASALAQGALQVTRFGSNSEKPLGQASALSLKAGSTGLSGLRQILN